MVSVLAPSSPLHEPSTAHGFGRSCSSIGSATSTGTVQHHRLRSISGSSLSSLTSLWAPALRRQDGGTPSKSSSSHHTTLRRAPTHNDRRSISGSFTRRASFASVLSSKLRPDSLHSTDQTESKLEDVVKVDSKIAEASEDELSFVEEEEEASQTSGTAARQPAGPPTPGHVAFAEPARSDDGSVAPPESSAGMRRWLSTLRRRKQKHPPTTTVRAQRWTMDEFDAAADDAADNPSSSRWDQFRGHKNSDSQSLAFVTGVKSATVTLASFATLSRKNSKWRRSYQRSSVVSGSDARRSIDSQRSVMDEAAKQRARKRRDKMVELISTEESYVSDLKALANAYLTILGYFPTTASFARESARENISEMLQLHEELVRKLHEIVPFAEADQQRMAKAHPESSTRRSHTRWHSVDVVPSRTTPVRSRLATIRQGRRSLNISRSSEDTQLALRCSPGVIASVANMFAEHIERFEHYEDFSSNFELVKRDIEELQRTIPTWSDFDRAIESLSAHLNPVKSREANRRRALTIKDLLIKPIQRLPRYELLFGELCKLTPSCDDPVAHSAIQDLLVQLNKACQSMNASKTNPSRARMMEQSCVLGDRLTFSNQIPRTAFLGLLGQVQLCGCLYIAYRGKDRIKGAYVISVLFQSTLLLATAEDDQQKYSTLAGIPLANAAIVESDNGKGLQCYTAPHTWKLVFEHSTRIFEFVVTACSAVESDTWREHLESRIEAQAQSAADGPSRPIELQSPLTAEMRSVGKAFGRPSSFVRRMSVHRTATVGPTSDVNQVIIKNTQAVKEAVKNTSGSSLQIPRSQSVATPSHVQTLAPRRAERVRLESLLADVWTKDALPYPGMQPRRSDPLRASANNVIRKFSMASITSNFSSKRSASHTSMSHNARKEDAAPSGSKGGKRYKPDASAPPVPQVPLVDFHNTPDAFLPADFGVPNPRAKGPKRSAFRTFTMTVERPFSPLLGNSSNSNNSSANAANNASTASTANASTRPPASFSTSTSSATYQTALQHRPRSAHSGSTSVHPERLQVPAQPSDESASASGSLRRAPTPVYSVVQERARTPAKLQKAPPAGRGVGSDETLGVGWEGDAEEKTPRKKGSRGKLLRVFERS